MINMRPILLAFPFAFALLAAASPAAAQTVQDFQLPPSDAETPSQPEVQGPVDDSGIVARPPRALNTPQPQPTATSTPTPQTTPTATAPSPDAAASPAPSPSAVRSLPEAGPATRPSPAATLPAGTPSPAIAQPGFDFSTTPTQLPDASVGPPPPGETAATTFWTEYWPWALGLLALLATGAWYWRSRQNSSAAPPEIERPIVPEPADEPSAQPAPVAKPASDIGIRLEAVSLSRSLMNVTLRYQLTITNRTLAMIDNLAVMGDLVSARPGVSLAQQVANAQVDLPQLQEITRLSGKQTKDFSGKIVLPVSALVPVRQGALLYVPLLRLRIEGQLGGPMFKTFVIGARPNAAGGKLQPFRIDEQPQTHSQIEAQPLG